MKKFLVLCLSVFMALGIVGTASAAPFLFADANGDALPDISITLAPGQMKTLDIWVAGLSEVLPVLGGVIDTGNFLTFGTNIYFNQNLPSGVIEDFVPPQISVASASINPDPILKFSGSATINPYNPSGLNPDTRRAHVQLRGNTEELLGLDITDPDIGENILLGTIVFQCEGIGNSVIDLSAPNAGGFLTTEAINITSAIDFETYDVDVSQVPIPGTLLLLGSGLAGLIGLRKRAKRA